MLVAWCIVHRASWSILIANSHCGICTQAAHVAIFILCFENTVRPAQLAMKWNHIEWIANKNGFSFVAQRSNSLFKLANKAKEIARISHGNDRQMQYSGTCAKRITSFNLNGHGRLTNNE